MKVIKKIIIRSYPQLRNKLNEYKESGGYIFRGNRDVYTNLIPGLFRNCHSEQDREIKLNEFIEKMKNKYSIDPKIEGTLLVKSVFNALAHEQHDMRGTVLTDITFDPYCAAFFSFCDYDNYNFLLSEKKGSREILAIKTKNDNGKVFQKLKDGNSNNIKDELRELYNLSKQSAYLHRQEDDVNLNILNLISQEGGFVLAHPDISKGIECEQLIICDPKIIKRALQEFGKKHINHHVMYQGHRNYFYNWDKEKCIKTNENKIEEMTQKHIVDFEKKMARSRTQIMRLSEKPEKKLTGYQSITIDELRELVKSQEYILKIDLLVSDDLRYFNIKNKRDFLDKIWKIVLEFDSPPIDRDVRYLFRFVTSSSLLSYKLNYMEDAIISGDVAIHIYDKYKDHFSETKDDFSMLKYFSAMCVGLSDYYYHIDDNKSKHYWDKSIFTNGNDETILRPIKMGEIIFGIYQAYEMLNDGCLIEKDRVLHLEQTIIKVFDSLENFKNLNDDLYERFMLLRDIVKLQLQTIE